VAPSWALSALTVRGVIWRAADWAGAAVPSRVPCRRRAARLPRRPCPGRRHCPGRRSCPGRRPSVWIGDHYREGERRPEHRKGATRARLERGAVGADESVKVNLETTCYIFISRRRALFFVFVQRCDVLIQMKLCFVLLFLVRTLSIMTEPADYLRTAVCARAPVQQRYKNYAVVSRHTLVRDTVSTC
jgi:hypothetical protein